MQAPSVGYRRFLRVYLTPQRARLAVLAMLMLVDLVLHLGLPRVVQTFIDGAIAGSELRTLLWIGIAYLAVAIGQNLAQVGWQYVAQNVGLIATNRIRTDLTHHCLKLDMSFHNARTPGEMIERVDGDVSKLANFLSQFVVQVILNGLLLIGVVLLLFRLDWSVGLPAAVSVLVAAVCATILTGPLATYSVRERQASAELFGLLEERLSGTEDIRANGAVAFVLRRHIERSRTLFRTSVVRALLGMISWRSLNMAITIGGIVALARGAFLALDGVLTIGQVYLIFAYTTMLTRPVEELMRQLDDMQQAIAGMTRVQQLFATTSRVVDTEQGSLLPDGPLSVELEAVSFAYPGDELVLREVSMLEPAGSVLGLLGRTGSGKTTLTRLLLRLYDPSTGEVRLGGVDLRRVPNANLRARVAVVTQDIQLFSATVRENLTLFDPTIADAQVLAALDTLGMGDWVRALPAGLDTLLASSGTGLSAGQAQLLAFARAFLRDPGLIILDEASSRLDPATERQLDQALTRLLRGRTAIIIAHRLGTLERVDHIMILEDGYVRERGLRADLVRDPDSRFAQLLRVGMEDALA
ncbi:MAG: Heterodimeric efflux ABC transporter, permease/ATP-binding subunit 1 [uncultured Chloroflexia bacterium]|uniref:Heterodimeric efflux ABC transporter, permease/ATP-binding subunit 1 n=1 Tax=uncultured Chloroflexia bacterium TaxID=1672391 RepID=A0A6J4H966_9CHLR|nr:MAG: Heterodimeric efflux ABC transporter, permease/ATP-binding subunit 1 [uncultured Chloroflexia bacterium]